MAAELGIRRRYPEPALVAVRHGFEGYPRVAGGGRSLFAVSRSARRDPDTCGGAVRRGHVRCAGRRHLYDDGHAHERSIADPHRARMLSEVAIPAPPKAVDQHKRTAWVFRLIPKGEREEQPQNYRVDDQVRHQIAKT